MSRPSQRHLARAVLESFGRTYADEVGIRLEDAPAPLFQLLSLSLLLSARIAADNAVRAARALREANLTTPEKMADATWQQRVDVLTANGYKRYDESGSRMLGETAERLRERYGGDLRKLRDEADRDVQQEHRLLQQFKGIGPVGADIFLREVQGIWDECFPYVDDRVGKAAKQLDLPTDPPALAELVERDDFPRFVAGLIRVDLADAYDEIQSRAG
jgi:endonuclease III